MRTEFPTEPSSEKPRPAVRDGPLHDAEQAAGRASLAHPLSDLQGFDGVRVDLHPPLARFAVRQGQAGHAFHQTGT